MDEKPTSGDITLPTDEKPTSRNIPLPMQREVRQRCGFGCVICGMPLYEYEHMEGWATVSRHVAEEITLLCDRHHRERTSKLLPIDAVKKANESPFNLRKGTTTTKPYDLHFSGEQAEITLGNNKFSSVSTGSTTILKALVIDDAPMLGFILQDGHLLLNVIVFNEFNELVLRIQNNQLVANVNSWDISFVGTTFTIRTGPGKILLEIEFLPPDQIHIQRGRFLKNGIEVLIRPTHILIVNNKSIITKCNSRNVYAGLVIGYNPITNSEGGVMLSMEKIERYGVDRKAALSYEKTEMK